MPHQGPVRPRRLVRKGNTPLGKSNQESRKGISEIERKTARAAASEEREPREFQNPTETSLFPGRWVPDFLI